MAWIEQYERIRQERDELAEVLVDTTPNIGFIINYALQAQRRRDAHDHNLVLGGIQFGEAWDVIGEPADHVDVGWGA